MATLGIQDTGQRQQNIKNNNKTTTTTKNKTKQKIHTTQKQQRKHLTKMIVPSNK